MKTAISNKSFVLIIISIFCGLLAILFLKQYVLFPQPERKAFNIDFGAWRPALSEKSGPAAVGKQGDFWNVAAVAWNDDHTESNLKYTSGEESPISVRMINLGGGWGCGGALGVKDPMLDNFNYPANNQGGNSQVIISHLPKGNYDLYLYGHGTDPAYYGDYAVSVAERSYGRKATSNHIDAVTSTEWMEGKQYVVFSNISVSHPAELTILIQPGGLVSDGTRTFRDAMIAGLQLIPKN